jgi:hypothetical protein
MYFETNDSKKVGLSILSIADSTVTAAKVFAFMDLLLAKDIFKYTLSKKIGAELTERRVTKFNAPQT